MYLLCFQIRLSFLWLLLLLLLMLMLLLLLPTLLLLFLCFQNGWFFLFWQVLFLYQYWLLLWFFLCLFHLWFWFWRFLNLIVHLIFCPWNQLHHILILGACYFYQILPIIGSHYLVPHYIGTGLITKYRKAIIFLCAHEQHSEQMAQNPRHCGRRGALDGKCKGLNFRDKNSDGHRDTAHYICYVFYQDEHVSNSLNKNRWKHYLIKISQSSILAFLGGCFLAFQKFVNSSTLCVFFTNLSF